MSSTNDEKVNAKSLSTKQKRQNKQREDAKKKLEKAVKARQATINEIEEIGADEGRTAEGEIAQTDPVEGNITQEEHQATATQLDNHTTGQTELDINEPDPSIMSSLAIDQSKQGPQTAIQVNKNRIKTLSTADHVVKFDNVLKEINQWDFKTIQVDSKSLAKTLTKFVVLGSAIHILTPDDLTIIANHNGIYPNKEETLVHKNGKDTVPNTRAGLMANGTKLFDALIYLSMEPERRPLCSPIDIITNKSGDVEVPTYDDLEKLTTYIHVALFYILIRAHLPSEANGHKNQPMPKFITSVMNVTESIEDITDYLASFDLQKLHLSWFQSIPINMSQKTVNRLGLSVAGYRIVSVFNKIKPDLYAEAPVPKGKIDIKKKPDYIDDAINVARSFVDAGYCWDFHPATRNPNVITKYGNINKNASNLLIECYTTATLANLVKIKKLAVMPQFDLLHTNFRLWDASMTYKATKPIFRMES